MKNETNEERLEAHRKLHNIGLPPHPYSCQSQLQIAVGHLQSILNTRCSATEMYEIERQARDWLQSIGSEPTR